MPNNKNRFLIASLLCALLFAALAFCVKISFGSNAQTTVVTGQIQSVGTGSVQVVGTSTISNANPQITYIVTVVYTNGSVPFTFNGTNATATVGGTNFGWVVTHLP